MNLWCTSRRVVLSALLLICVAPATSRLQAVVQGDDVPWDLRQQLISALGAEFKKLEESKNEYGAKNKRWNYSRNFKRIDENTHRATVHIETASAHDMTTERLDVTLKKESGKWKVADQKVVETFGDLHRQYGGRCYPFETFNFDRHGMKLSGSNGGVCEYYWEGTVESFKVMSSDMKWEYTAPRYQDYYSLQRIHMMDPIVRPAFDFQAQYFAFECDPVMCEELLESSFTGLDRQPPAAADERPEAVVGGTGVPDALWKLVSDEDAKASKQRKESPFIGFRLPEAEDNHWFVAKAHKNEKNAVGIYYDNWGGFEVQAVVDLVHPVAGEIQNLTIFGYYTDETMESHPPYELEQRDDHINPRLTAGFNFSSRWFDVKSLVGTVEAALEDPERLDADIRYGLTVKQQLKHLPFFIVGISREGPLGREKSPPIFVNSVQLDGEELTVVRTSPISGMVILPETVPAGTTLDLRMNFSTRAIVKINPAFSVVAHGGWLPFVRFGDFIHPLDLTLRTPARYEPLGIGRKVSEKKEGDVLVTEWVADNPVEFPSLIFGKYISDDSGDYKAKKLDGTVIPVEVHVDTASTADWGIRPKQLKAIAIQAAASINLFAELSGLDYPYGELNLVNDPFGFLYGQAPSSLIYLGSGVFRGEGYLASIGGGTSTSKFLKSVTSHEVGHQWWGSRVSNANSRNYWFVESLAEYFSAIYLERAFGQKEYFEQVEEWRRMVLDNELKASVQHASVLYPGSDNSYVAAVYNKGPLAFHMLRQIFGDERFFPFLKEFTQKLAAKGEIVTRDIQMVAEEALGGVGPDGQRYNADLGWFFDQWIRGVGIPEYRLVYDVRDTEGGGVVIEGTIYQRVVVGNRRNKQVLEGKYYRAKVPISVIFSKGREGQQEILIDGPEVPFRFALPEKPLEVTLNRYHTTLAHDPVVNKSW